MMRAKNNIPWKRLLAEGAAIVASILLAFWIQASWDERQERSAERVVLQSLLDDLADKKEILVRQRIGHAAKLESVTRLLQAATDANRTIDRDSIDAVLFNLLWYNQDSTWESAPMISVTGGGKSSLITSEVLLQKLAALQVTISRVRNNYKNERDFYYNAITPFFMNNANLAQIAANGSHLPGLPDAAFEFPEINISSPRDHTTLLSRDDFQGLLFTKIDLQLDIQRTIESEGLRENIDEIIKLLSDELEKL